MSKRTYTLRPIRTQADYDEALKLVEPFFDSDPDPDSDEGAYFDALATLIEAYEAKHFSAMAKLPPVHPGEVLREEFMKPYGLSSNALAAAIGVTPARVNDIARERRGITADTALRLARYFGTDAQSWLNLQQRYEIECAQDAVGDVLQSITPLALARAA